MAYRPLSSGAAHRHVAARVAYRGLSTLVAHRRISTRVPGRRLSARVDAYRLRSLIDNASRLESLIDAYRRQSLSDSSRFSTLVDSSQSRLADTKQSTMRLPHAKPGRARARPRLAGPASLPPGIQARPGRQTRATQPSRTSRPSRPSRQLAGPAATLLHEPTGKWRCPGRQLRVTISAYCMVDVAAAPTVPGHPRLPETRRRPSQPPSRAVQPSTW